MDILQALADAAPVKSSRRCKLGQLLDGIPAEAAGRDQLTAAVETSTPDGDGYRPLAQTLLVLHRLGLGVSDKTLGDHRRQVCRCYQ